MSLIITGYVVLVFIGQPLTRPPIALTDPARVPTQDSPPATGSPGWAAVPKSGQSRAAAAAKVAQDQPRMPATRSAARHPAAALHLVPFVR